MLDAPILTTSPDDPNLPTPHFLWVRRLSDMAVLTAPRVKPSPRAHLWLSGSFAVLAEAYPRLLAGGWDFRGSCVWTDVHKEVRQGMHTASHETFLHFTRTPRTPWGDHPGKHVRALMKAAGLDNDELAHQLDTDVPSLLAAKSTTLAWNPLPPKRYEALANLACAKEPTTPRMTFAECEALMLVCPRYQSTVWGDPRPSGNEKVGKKQFPLDLTQPILRDCTLPGDTVWEIGGDGAAIEAATLLGRRGVYIGTEDMVRFVRARLDRPIQASLAPCYALGSEPPLPVTGDDAASLAGVGAGGSSGAAGFASSGKRPE